MNALSPILVILDGMLMCFRDEHPRNALRPMLVMPLSGNMIDSMFRHMRNAESSTRLIVSFSVKNARVDAGG